MIRKIRIIDKDIIKFCLSYDPNTGIFIWIHSSRQTKFGSMAGYKNPKGYVVIKIKKKTYYAHRLAWFFIHGYFPKEIDHANRNKSDNRIKNLRECSRSQNCANKKDCNKKSNPKRGTYKNGEKFNARLGIQGNSKHLGNFRSEEEAHQAYKKAHKKEYGEFSPY